MTIYKYPLLVQNTQEIKMPIGAQIISVQTQHDIPCVWAKVNEKNKLETKTIEVFGTGHPMNDASRIYLGTVQMHGWSLVFHIFERL